MCGIVGIWEYGASEGRIAPELIDAMRDTMPHRGPDDVGSYLFDKGRGGLGFRRLSIIDLSAAGHQPMHGCESRNVWLVFNGEIYNHRELRPDLESRGHVYRSQTDSETIVHLYEEVGVDFVDEIEGDFGIGLWDEEKQELSLYRDRLGVKPLYYYIRDGRIIFASEIKGTR
jgi:asparagine synthase (glutamine-hydrolysing)